jgi:Mrp family chromosome partitioning ATPase
MLNFSEAESLAADNMLSESETGKPKLRQPGPKRFCIFDAEAFLKMEIKPLEFLLHPWLPSPGVAMVFAPRGVGKTYFSLNVAYAVASGGSFLKWQAPTPKSVLYLDGEMSASVMQRRLAEIVKANDQPLQKPLRSKCLF